MKTNWGRKSLATLPLMSERECGIQRKNPLIGGRGGPGGAWRVVVRLGNSYPASNNSLD